MSSAVFGRQPLRWGALSWLGVATVAAVVAPLALWSWVAVQTRADTIAAAEAERQHVTAAISEQALKLLGEQALVLDLLDRQAGNADCAALRADASVQGLMSVAAERAPQTDAIFIIDRAGYICLSSDPARLDRRDRSNREFFTGARAMQADGYYVERAIVGPLDGIGKVSIAKPRIKDGVFGGVTIAAVRIDHIVRDWRKIVGEAPSERIALFRLDGATVARSWDSLVQSPDPDRERRLAAPWQDAPRGGFVGPSRMDGALRIGAWQVLPEWGVVVTSSVDEYEALRPWRRQTALYGVLAGLAAGLLSTLTWSLRRTQVRLRWANADLSGLVSDRTATLETTAAAAERSADYLERLVNSNIIGICTFNKDGVVRANHAFLRMVGLDRAALDAGPIDWRILTPPEYLAVSERALGQLIDAGECEPFEKEYFRSDGTRVPVMLGAARASEAPLEWTAFVIDITDRKRAENALRQSEAQFRIAAEAMPGMLFVAGVTGGILYVNSGACLFSGQVAADLLGRSWTELLHPDDVAHAVAAWRETAVGQSQAIAECRFRRQDGEWRWHLLKALPVSEFNAHSDCGVAVCVDIHDRRLLELDLECRVDERSRELEATQQRLAHTQRMDALGQLAGGIAHDFNNVIQAVVGATSLIERRAEDVGRVRSLARMAGEAAARGAAVTRRLLVFARRGDLRVEPVDAGALLGGMREILSHTLGSGILIGVHVEAGLPPVLADKGQLETVLVNLATNARDAMQGEGMLTLRAARHVVVEADRSGQPRLGAGPYVRFAVADTGIGMTAEVLAKASEPFFTTKQVGQGTGLGLAMARGFAEQSGGGLHIESAPGRGTVVELWLPVASEDALPAYPAVRMPIVAAPDDATARLLLVDDDALVRETIAQQMEAEGYSVRAVADGAAGLVVLDSGEAIDLVISDLSMPGMSGVTFVHEALRRRPSMPAILLTGFATDGAELAMGGAMSGAFTLLRKPIEGKVLAERVAVMLAGIEAGQIA